MTHACVDVCVCVCVFGEYSGMPSKKLLQRNISWFIISLTQTLFVSLSVKCMIFILCEVKVVNTAGLTLLSTTCMH